MPVRVGVDLVPVQDVRDALAAFGERYLRRIYSDREIADCSAGSRPRAPELAARFAAKEAVLKVLQIGHEPVPWREIEVTGTHRSLHGLLLSGCAATLAEKSGIAEFGLSLSCRQGIATALVVAQCQSP